MPVDKSTKQAKKPLSSLTIKALKPGQKDLSDTGENAGLRIHCGATGTKTYFYRYTSPVTKKLMQLKIGNYPLKTLAGARLKLQELKVIRKSGRCPATEIATQKQEKEAAQAKQAHETDFTVQEMVELYLTHFVEDRMIDGKRKPGARKPKGQSETRRTLYGDAVRTFGEISASKIIRKDVVDLILEIVNERGANVQAGNVLRELSAAYEYAIGVGKFEESFANPAVLAKASLRQAKIKLTSKKGKRTLSDEELIKFLKWLPGSVFTQTQKNVMRFTLWTGCRTGEVCLAEWKNVNLEDGIWDIKESKTGVGRHVQLPTQATDFLKQLRLTTGDYLFPSQKTGLPIQQKSMTVQAWQLRTTNRMLDIDHWTPHDLRRTVRTGLSRLRCPSEVAEAVLAHTRKGIEGTYDLHKYEPECREWLQKWADHLDELIAGKG